MTSLPLGRRFDGNRRQGLAVHGLADGMAAVRSAPESWSRPTDDLLAGGDPGRCPGGWSRCVRMGTATYCCRRRGRRWYGSGGRMLSQEARVALRRESWDELGRVAGSPAGSFSVRSPFRE